MQRMRQLIHLQATGLEIGSNCTPEQAREIITVALRGRCVLLIIDDVWEPSHEAALNFIDTETRSKTLVTTRIRGLGGGIEVVLGVPSAAEAVKMLLSSAGLGQLNPIPPEAQEVVKICGSLPLALDLSGKLLRDLGVSGSETDDWTGIPKLLQEEMRRSITASDDEDQLEYRVIAASLNAIPLRDREAAKQCFSVFALVAEDTYVPIEAFRILLSAVTGEAELMPELKLRRLLQVLVSRCVTQSWWYLHCKYWSTSHSRTCL
jgi:hypothetical protein